MNTMKKIISILFSALLIVALCCTTNQANAQATMMKDCCMMKDGKMMHMKDGKEMPMAKNMTMKNGTKCMTNGECVMKDGKKMQMKDGQCMDMGGKMDNCSMMMTATYTCPMHPEVITNKPGKCPKCGMTLVKKK